MSKLIVSVQEDDHERLSAIQSALGPVTIPILRRNKKSSRIEVCSTGFCLKVCENLYVITASHSIDDLSAQSDWEYLLGVDGKTTIIPRIFRPNEREGASSLDIAAIPISRESEFFEDFERFAIPIGSAMYRKEFSDIDIQFVQGFVKNINKSPKNYDSENMNLVANVFGYAQPFEKSVDFSHYEKDSRFHYAIKWVDRVNGNKVMSPAGLSGAGYWFFPDQYNIDRKFLAGVFIEYHKKDSVAFVTKIDHVINLIENI